MAELEEVFGVSAKPVLSYVERQPVDARFAEAIASDKQIIVYGSSKQGKTALVSKHLPFANHIVISLTPRMAVVDIYQAILSKAGIYVSGKVTEKTGTEGSLTAGAKVTAQIPLFAGGEATTQGTIGGQSSVERQFDSVPTNLELPQSIADLLQRINSKKWVILDNFHYLNDDMQKQIAFDLRAYQELGIRFVILGVWREKNRMAQFNGDLLDRIIEIPVEPWTPADFQRVVEKGAKELNVTFSSTLIDVAIEASFSSIGVFQELLKGTCQRASVTRTAESTIVIDDLQLLADAKRAKASDYAARHQRALEAIAAGHISGGVKGELPPLTLPYYLVRVILEHGFEGIAQGMKRSDIHTYIKLIHHRGDDVRGSDMSNLLHGLANLQAAKSISPPIIDYDSQSRMLQVVDSTFYFFIKNADTAEILAEIPNPLAI
jgi:hypothetical protein